MNTTETGEPLGEGPVDTLAVIEHGAARGFWQGADAVLAVKQLAERQAQVLNAVRELHTESTYWKNCGCCHEPWPCGTIMAIDEADA